MSTWLQELILAVQNTNDVAPSLSSYLSESLKTMQQYDRISNKIKMEIKSYEKKLIDKLESECKSKTSEELQNLDETEYKNGLQILNSKRQKLSQIYDYQLKIANSCYELIDKKISAFDSAVQPISLQYPNILPSLNDTNEVVIIYCLLPLIQLIHSIFRRKQRLLKVRNVRPQRKNKLIPILQW